MNLVNPRPVRVDVYLAEQSQGQGQGQGTKTSSDIIIWPGTGRAQGVWPILVLPGAK